MEETKSEGYKICSHLKALDEKKFKKSLQECLAGAECFNSHVDKIDPNQLIISLKDYRIGCSRKSPHLCLQKLFEKDSSYAVTYNPNDGNIL